MDYLADTNILVRAVHKSDPNFRLARGSLKLLVGRGHTLCLVAQNIIEFWSVCTRPVDANGLGFSIARTRRYVLHLESSMDFLPDTPAIYTEWLRLVTAQPVTGRQVHDARIVAAMNQDFHFDPGTATVYTHAARIPRLSALNPAHQLRRQAPKPVRPLTDVDGTG